MGVDWALLLVREVFSRMSKASLSRTLLLVVLHRMLVPLTLTVGRAGMTIAILLRMGGYEF